MSYTFLLESGEESSAASFSDIPVSVLSRLNLTAGKSSCNVSETAFSPDSQSGMTFAPLMENHTGAKWTSSGGGFPCTDISVAGKGAGIEGDESGLWAEMARIICEVQPRYVFVENSPALTIRGLGRVLGDLASMGYDARWGVLGAYFCGYPHRRDRIWIVADSQRFGLEGRDYLAEKGQWERKGRSMASLCEAKVRHDVPSPDAFGTPNGIPRRMERTRAVGNAQVPQVAATAWRILS